MQNHKTLYAIAGAELLLIGFLYFLHFQPARPMFGAPTVQYTASTTVATATSSPWGLFSINPNNIGAKPAFVIGSSTATNLVVTNAGKVGIGTAAPGYLLQIAGASSESFNISGTNSTGAVFAHIQNSDGSAGLYYGTESNTGGSVFTGGLVKAAVLGTGNATALQFASNNIVRTTIDTSGNLGIGSTSPAGTLAVSIASTTPALFVGALGSSTPSLFVGSANSNGLVGIGTSNPSAKLHIVQDNAITGIGNNGILQLHNSLTGNNITAELFFKGGNSGIASTIGTQFTNNASGIGDIFFATRSAAGFSEKMRIMSTGLVGISTTTHWALLSVNPTSTLGSGVPEFVVGSSTSTHFSVLGSGNVGIGTAAPLALLHVNGDAAAVLIGTGANTATGISFASGRSFLGYDGLGMDVQGGAGKPIFFRINSGTFGAGTISLNANISGDIGLGGAISDTVLLTGSTMVVLNSGLVAVGTTTPFAQFQVTNPSANATTTLEFGKANQTKGTCLKLYRGDGSAIYAYVAAGATTFTLSTTACASVTGF